jgi:hypothetical protein
MVPDLHGTVIIDRVLIVMVLIVINTMLTHVIECVLSSAIASCAQCVPFLERGPHGFACGAAANIR